LPTPTVPLNLEPVSHHEKHPVNKAIKELNRAVKLIWGSRKLDVEEKLMVLTKRLGEPLKTQDLRKEVHLTKEFRLRIK